MFNWFACLIGVLDSFHWRTFSSLRKLLMWVQILVSYSQCSYALFFPFSRFNLCDFIFRLLFRNFLTNRVESALLGSTHLRSQVWTSHSWSCKWWIFNLVRALSIDNQIGRILAILKIVQLFLDVLSAVDLLIPNILSAAKPRTFIKTVFIQMLSGQSENNRNKFLCLSFDESSCNQNITICFAEDEWAFDLLYCVAFMVMDKQWLDRNASYMEFNVKFCLNRFRLLIARV